MAEETIRGWLPPQAPDAEPPGRWDSKLAPDAPADPSQPGAGDPDDEDRGSTGIPTGFRREPGR
jgi:hypothetical protein